MERMTMPGCTRERMADVRGESWDPSGVAKCWFVSANQASLTGCLRRLFYVYNQACLLSGGV
jgi:hypothetical protein